MMSASNHRQPLRISVCIPTCSRPELIVRSVGSILRQTQLPIEILIGDDSGDGATAEVVHRLQADSPVPIRLFRNHPPYGLGRNVASLFARVDGDAILLLHDDDTLEPSCIQTLAGALSHEGVIVAFGRSWMVDRVGRKDPVATAELNEYYHRTAEYRGVIRDTLSSAALQQMPDSGFMVRTEAAQCASYAWAARYRNACGFVYNVELALRAAGAFYFCDELLHCYHRTDKSLSKSPSGNSAVMSFAYAQSLDGRIEKRELYRQWMCERSTVAIGQAARLGLLSEAWGWYFGPYHRGRIFSRLGFKAACKLLWAFARGRHRNPAKLPLPGKPMLQSAEVDCDFDPCGIEELSHR